MRKWRRGTLSMNGADGTISGIGSSSWWMQFGATDLLKLPTNLAGATGWKLEFTNTGAGGLNLILVVSTAANGWRRDWELTNPRRHRDSFY